MNTAPLTFSLGKRTVTLSVPLAAGLLSGIGAFITYLCTLAPNVTLADSGELITAAVTLGVAHSPGYPLWTTIAHLFVALLPVGNVAWRVHVSSGFLAAAACGMTGWLVADSVRWLLGERNREAGLNPHLLPFVSGLAAGLTLAFSHVMWTQSVIAEVFPLNAALTLALFIAFYRWCREPERTDWLLAALFFFAFGLANHQGLLMLMPVLPIAVWRTRPSFFPDFLASYLLIGGGVAAGLAWLSRNPLLQQTAQRLDFLLLAAVLGLALWRGALEKERWERRRFVLGLLAGALPCAAVAWVAKQWFVLSTANGWIVLVLFALIGGATALSRLDGGFIVKALLLTLLGLSPYLLMPLYSSTNPPMNWGYARTQDGFFHSISRGQYEDNLTNLIVNTAGPLVGTAPPPEVAQTNVAPKEGRIYLTAKSVVPYFEGLVDNFTLPLCLLAFLSLFLFGNLPPKQRKWLFFLVVAFLFLSLFLTLIAPPPEWDKTTWKVRQRFYLSAHCVFAIALGYGIAGGLLALRRYSREVSPALFLLAPLLSFLPFSANEAASTLRGHWFGWLYGTEMLRPLEKGAVVFGGTDPGRFVPTYMIFCESPQPARWKRDPAFDRSDLYLITQNALADGMYLHYLSDQYDAQRHITRYNAFERWLGRDKAYPPDGGLRMPDDVDLDTALNDAMHSPSPAQAQAFQVNADLSRLLFERNKDRHAFYVEESFPILWMYPHLVPSGIIMKIEKEPLDTIPPEAVARDRAYWKDLCDRLLSDPKFLDDQDARTSFSKLRVSIANVYAYRHMQDEALSAYGDALRLDPFMPEAVVRLASYLLSLDRFDEAEKLIQGAVADDPRNGEFEKFSYRIAVCRKLATQDAGAKEAIAKHPSDPAPYRLLFSSYMARQKSVEAAQLFGQLLTHIEVTPEEIANTAHAFADQGEAYLVEPFLEANARRHPADGILLYQAACLHALAQHPEAAFRDLAAALAMKDGERIRAALAEDASWSAYRESEGFKKAQEPTAAQAQAQTQEKALATPVRKK